MAGSGPPKGRAQAVPGGYRLTGSWTQGSNIRLAAWVLAGCHLYDGDRPRLGPDNAPLYLRCVIGQCLLQGYSGLGRADIFPALAARRLETSLDETRVAVSAGEFYHPAQVLREVDRSIGSAEVIVVDAAALSVATGVNAVDMSRFPGWVVGVNERFRHLRRASVDDIKAL